MGKKVVKSGRDMRTEGDMIKEEERIREGIRRMKVNRRKH